NRKYGLSTRRSISNSLTNELIDLVTDGVMTQAEIVKLASSEKSGMAAIADVANSRQFLMNPYKPYPLLRSYTENLQGKALNRGLAADNFISTILPQESTLLTFVLGSDDLNVSPGRTVKLEMAKDLRHNFLQAVLDLWGEGVD